ncbi:(deoxy)nucleoside triphosphate pyrophosphohydrolase [Ancylomarina euxinus]|uniref:8-oxo-dGTP diphosphatase n=1 Tax=Ancylomarina euxinus TaxID=2283627 RepID=A0A425XWU4_9BACT|nr:(deoxy)nucleoside triphosphate pyrophosphohydrolase [Ancylomarina euxinus]MCZ4696309.1 (deoxy)nucleoside triphosphate pyrophosphohydrolase [Ancylomarina euxinus]MUP16726.1 NUDIX domain-containing protein [Ancylomarina euxinus]RRG19111.1 (deoxy)nucleoside triphosphate pyrophosphohydrolase [Ancylomarina euxinus]
MNSKKIVEVTAAIIRKDNRFLCAQRKDSSEQGGKWEFPGGKIEDGETPEACLERELQEEFNIQAKCGNFLCENMHDYGNKIIKLKAYFVDHMQGNFKLLVHQDIKWLALDQIHELDWAEADLPIVNQLINDLK